MKITWDEDKNTLNKRKHDISFEAAKLVFDDPLHISRQDRIVDGEERWQAIGSIGAATLRLVAHTWSNYAGEENVRIISARLALKNEREDYESNFGSGSRRNRRAGRQVRRGH